MRRVPAENASLDAAEGGQIPKFQRAEIAKLLITGLAKQLGRYGAGRAKLAAKHPKSLTLPALVPPLHRHS